MTDNITGEELGNMLLQSVKEMKAGKAARAHSIEISEITEARHALHMSQADFSVLLGVPKSTIQDWEQGRRQPRGPAVTLLNVAKYRPEALRDVLLIRQENAERV